jgi:hypothetical protein
MLCGKSLAKATRFRAGATVAGRPLSSAGEAAGVVGEHGGGFVRAHGATEEVALHLIALQLPQALPLFDRFDAFGDDLHAPAVGHGDDRRREGGIAVVLANETDGLEGNR